MGRYGLLRRGNVVTKLMKLLMVVRLSGNLFNRTESQKNPIKIPINFPLKPMVAPVEPAKRRKVATSSDCAFLVDDHRGDLLWDTRDNHG